MAQGVLDLGFGIASTTSTHTMPSAHGGDENSVRIDEILQHSITKGAETPHPAVLAISCAKVLRVQFFRHHARHPQPCPMLTYTMQYLLLEVLPVCFQEDAYLTILAASMWPHHRLRRPPPPLWQLLRRRLSLPPRLQPWWLLGRRPRRR